MKRTTFACALALTVSRLGLAHALPPDDPALVKAANALREAALKDDRAYTLTERIVTEFGPRPMGSPAQHAASRWAAAELTAMGFDKVAVESFSVPGWYLGGQSASVTSPYPQALDIITLGGSVPTPAGGLEAEAVIFKTFDDLLAAAPGSLTGKIAVVTEPMPKLDSGDGYFNMGRNRGAGAVEAAKRGAVAYLVRSLSTAMTRSPHTGALRYSDQVTRIPAAALATSDAALLDRMAERGRPLRIRLDIRITVPDRPVQAHNVVADITGSEKPNEVVLIGAHIDSWGNTPGALDNASGVGIVMAAAKLVKDSAGRPKRTIRVVVFGAEEFGGHSGRAYAAAHDADRPSYILATESDSGAAYIQEIKLPGDHAGRVFGKTFANLLRPLGTRVVAEASTYGGVDVNSMKDVPLVSIRADLTDYFDVHHAEDDTMDKVDRDDMRKAVAAWAVLAHLAANSDVNFRK